MSLKLSVVDENCFSLVLIVFCGPQAIRKTLEKLGKDDLRIFKITLWKRYPESFSSPPQGMDMVDLVDRLLEFYDLEVALQLTKALLKDMGLKRLDAYITDLCKKSMHVGFISFDSCNNDK